MENLLNEIKSQNPMFDVINWFIHDIRDSGMIVMRSTQHIPGVATIKFVDGKGNDMSAYNPNGDNVFFAVACLRYETGQKDAKGKVIKKTRKKAELMKMRYAKGSDKVFKTGTEPLRGDGQPLFKCIGKMTTKKVLNKKGEVVREVPSDSLQWLGFNV